MEKLAPITDISSPAELKYFFRLVLRRFLIVYFMLAIMLAALLLYICQQSHANLENKVLDQEEIFVTSTIQAIQKEMHIQMMLLHMSTTSAQTIDFINKETPETRQKLQNYFSNLALTFHRYDHIRFIDLQGKERVRINDKNGQVYVVTEDALQDKSQTHYFQEGIKLAAGKVYVSPMELNKEHGVIQVPHKAVVRFVTPVFNAEGEKVGLIVLNYLATELLQNFRDKMKARPNRQGMLIDADGYWLSNHNKSNEWGNSLDSVMETFAQQYPAVWPQIKDKQDGILKTEQGIFRFKSIDPFNLDSISHFKQANIHKFSINKAARFNNDWKIIIYLPQDIILKASFFYSMEGTITLTFFFISLALITFLALIISEEKRRQYNYNAFVNDELNDLYQNAPCGYHTLDKHGNVLKMNKTELNWLGYTEKEVIGKSFAHFLCPSSQPDFNEFLRQLTKMKKIEGVVLKIKCKANQHFYISISATLINKKGCVSFAHTSAFDITERIQLEQHLEHFANTDSLTEISNRRHFFELSTSLLLQHETISLFMLDIDHFKKINDQYGHNVGDIVLKELVHIIQKQLPEEAIFSRLGGEEFAILLAGLDSQQSLILAKDLCNLIASTAIKINADTYINMTTSIGTAQRNSQQDSINALLKRADIALYEAKTTGRNKAV